MEGVCAQSIIDRLRVEVCEMGMTSGEVCCPLLEKLSEILTESEEINAGDFHFSDLPCGDLTCPCRIRRV